MRFRDDPGREKSLRKSDPVMRRSGPWHTPEAMPDWD
jgi:hypothetical protein